jgi:hypothetical protein
MKNELDAPRLAEAITLHRIALARSPSIYLDHACMGDCAPDIAAKYNTDHDIGPNGEGRPSQADERRREGGKGEPNYPPTDVPEGYSVVMCPTCGGTGQVPTKDWGGHMWCPTCPDGDGWWLAPTGREWERLLS